MRTRRLPEPTRVISIRILAVLLLCFFCCEAGFCGESRAISGRVLDSAGKPIAAVTVMVYHAGVTKGYSLFCPSCYRDCGKRTITDVKGTFRLDHLSPGLWFELLVAKSGYQPKFVKRVVPTSEVPVAVMLRSRVRVNDSKRIFRGRVVDSNGIAQHDAVVEPVGALLNAKTGVSIYGTVPGLEPIAVTNRNGVFEIESFPAKQSWMPPIIRPPARIVVSVEARGMAERFSVIPAGTRPHVVTVTIGDIVRGRLVQNGSPVEGAEIGLISKSHGRWGPNLKMIGSPYQEIRVGTRPDGSFEISNVPVPGEWYVYAKMESVASRGATGDKLCVTKHNGEIVGIGDLHLRPAYHLRGRIVLSDGKPIADGMTVTISSETAYDSQTQSLPPGGRFEFSGLAAGDYSIFASVRGYSPPPVAPVSVRRKDGRVMTYTPPPPPIPIQHNVDKFELMLHPDNSAHSRTAAAVQPASHEDGWGGSSLPFSVFSFFHSKLIRGISKDHEAQSLLARPSSSPPPSHALKPDTDLKVGLYLPIPTSIVDSSPSHSSRAPCKAQLA